MDQVYNNSLCNISATYASNSSKGLYIDRDSNQHWVDEVALNTEGVPGRPESEPAQEKKSFRDTVLAANAAKVDGKNGNLVNGLKQLTLAHETTRARHKDATPLEALKKYTILNLGF